MRTIMFDLRNKVALVTGARRGMGKTHALALARQGAKVIVTDINLPECQSVVDEITTQGGEAICFSMDVSKKSDIDRAFDEAVNRYGRLDILVNNAGIYSPKPALEVSEEEWDRMLNINLRGEFFCAQRAAREMAKHAWGRIVNIASVASGQVGIGIAGGVHYVASKGG
ncbi:SDR family NAD(P)-dependent oxidoreductase, partial [Patescibacteria group bacterium]|nr:SDR family NAD(P)-dependent oxidoreductase [Patescibacteria group bacterium]